MRIIKNINKGWNFVKSNVELDALLNQKAKSINIPHTWNNLDGQDGGADYHRGACWYYKKLGKINVNEDERIYLELNGANAICDVYLNGQQISHHEGGFSTFRVCLNQYLDNKNFLAIRVDNSANDFVYPQFADFTFFGGIYRDVNLITVNKVHFDLDYYGGSGVIVTPKVEDEKAVVDVECYIKNHNGEKIGVKVYDADRNLVYEETTDKPHFAFDIEKPRLWNGVIDPHLYTLELKLLDGENVLDNKEVRFGIRTFKIDANEGFFLNGKAYPLHGVSRHQDRLDMGWAITKKEHLEDMNLICEVGANTIRLAHYQHDQYFYDLCDERGMVVWAEIPFISNQIKNGHPNTLSQMRELIVQNYNHPSIVVWGLSNEITIGGENEELIKNHRELNDLVHSLDKTRLTTMAQVSMLDTKSEMNHISDVISYNHYFGWYGGEVSDNAVWFDKFHEENPEIPFGISEYGCEGILRWHNSEPQAGDYSEEYQAYYHYHMLETFATRPYLWATHVWNMFDFAVDMRDEGGVQGRNNKGLVTFDRKTKKDSFYLYQAYWTTKPMLHIAKKRYVNRCEDETEVLVYSNQPEVSLYVNGKLFETQKANKVFTFKVKLDKNLKLVAKAGDLTDKSVVKKVSEPCKDYILDGASGVKNWFDESGNEIKLTFDRDYFSIKDKIKDIMANPEGAAVLDAFMKKMISSMASDSNMKIPAGAEKMMGGFSIERIAGMLKDKVPFSIIAEVNVELQKIKK